MVALGRPEPCPSATLSNFSFTLRAMEISEISYATASQLSNNKHFWM